MTESELRARLTEAEQTIAMLKDEIRKLRNEIINLRTELAAERHLSEKMSNAMINFASLQPMPPIVISKELATELDIK